MSALSPRRRRSGAEGNERSETFTKVLEGKNTEFCVIVPGEECGQQIAQLRRLLLSVAPPPSTHWGSAAFRAVPPCLRTERIAPITACPRIIIRTLARPPAHACAAPRIVR